MSDPDINELARKQAVLEERVDSTRKEHTSGYERVITLLEANNTKWEAAEVKRDAKFDALEARMDANASQTRESLARLETNVAKMETRIVLWVVGWVIAVLVLGFAAARYLDDLPPTAAAPPAVAEQAAPAVSQR